MAILERAGVRRVRGEFLAGRLAPGCKPKDCCQFAYSKPSIHSMELEASDVPAKTDTDYDFRRHPERYRTDAAHDVLKAEPYASELLPYLHFRGDRAAPLRAGNVRYVHALS